MLKYEFGHRAKSSFWCKSEHVHSVSRSRCVRVAKAAGIDDSFSWHTGTHTNTWTESGQRYAMCEYLLHYAHRQSIKIICIIHHSSVITRCVLKLKSCATRIERRAHSPQNSCAKEFRIEKPFQAPKPRKSNNNNNIEKWSTHKRSITV